MVAKLIFSTLFITMTALGLISRAAAQTYLPSQQLQNTPIYSGLSAADRLREQARQAEARGDFNLAAALYDKADALDLKPIRPRRSLVPQQTARKNQAGSDAKPKSAANKPSAPKAQPRLVKRANKRPKIPPKAPALAQTQAQPIKQSKPEAPNKRRLAKSGSKTAKPAKIVAVEVGKPASPTLLKSKIAAQKRATPSVKAHNQAGKQQPGGRRRPPRPAHVRPAIPKKVARAPSFATPRPQAFQDAFQDPLDRPQSPISLAPPSNTKRSWQSAVQNQNRAKAVAPSFTDTPAHRDADTEEEDDVIGIDRLAARAEKQPYAAQRESWRNHRQTRAYATPAEHYQSNPYQSEYGREADDALNHADTYAPDEDEGINDRHRYHAHHTERAIEHPAPGLDDETYRSYSAPSIYWVPRYTRYRNWRDQARANRRLQYQRERVRRWFADTPHRLHRHWQRRFHLRPPLAERRARWWYWQRYRDAKRRAQLEAQRREVQKLFRQHERHEPTASGRPNHSRPARSRWLD